MTDEARAAVNKGRGVSVKGSAMQLSGMDVILGRRGILTRGGQGVRKRWWEIRRSSEARKGRLKGLVKGRWLKY